MSTFAQEATVAAVSIVAWVALAAYLLMTLVALEMPARLTARALRRRTGSGPTVIPAQAPRAPVVQQSHSVAAPVMGAPNPRPARDAPRRASPRRRVGGFVHRRVPVLAHFPWRTD